LSISQWRGDDVWCDCAGTFYYTNGEATGEAAKFVAFTLSDAGQQIAGNIGFVPPERAMSRECNSGRLDRRPAGRRFSWRVETARPVVVSA
jgi:hypothetical protein